MNIAYKYPSETNHDLIHMAATFYTCSYAKRSLSGMAKDRVMEYSREYNRALANSFRDYLALICLGEARHAPGCMRDGKKIYCNIGKKRYDLDGNSRSTIYGWAIEGTPEQILTETKAIFNMNWKGTDCGGKLWAEMADWGLQFRKADDVSFVDHTFDLEHHRGNIFDKPAMYNCDTDKLSDFLTQKTDGDILAVKMGIDRELYQLIGTRLGAHSCHPVDVIIPMISWKNKTTKVFMQAPPKHKYHITWDHHSHPWTPVLPLPPFNVASIKSTMTVNEAFTWANSGHGDVYNKFTHDHMNDLMGFDILLCLATANEYKWEDHLFQGKVIEMKPKEKHHART